MGGARRSIWPVGNPRARRVIVGIGVAAIVLVAVALSGSVAPGPSATPTAPAGAGIDLSPRVAPRPPGGDGALIGDIPSASRANARVQVSAHATPGGPPLALTGGTLAVTPGQDLAILGDPVAVDGTPWLRVYVLSNAIGGQTDFFTWVPASRDGQDTIRLRVPLGCPPTRDNLSTIAALDPFTRADCLGAASFTVEARTWWADLPVWYDVEPVWLGPWRQGTTSFSLHGPAGAAVDVRVPPGLEPPPPDITVRVDLHVADPAAATCTRSNGDLDVPAEAGPDSRLWCSVQLVADRWQPLLGPEGRPFDVADPQLHRSQPSSVCAGVGSGPLTFHTDPSALDPVWLEPAGGGHPILTWFGPAFRVAFMPDLVVVDGRGRVIARDGLTIDPDVALAGHSICTTIVGVHVN